MSKIEIVKAEKDSIAEEMGIQSGDLLIGINDKSIADVFDYRYAISAEYIELLIEKPDGEQWLLEIDKDEDEDLGLEFDCGLMDSSKHCANKCVFCFIDQLPKGMRSTLYFKDDDARLSFLQGNYVTLTNMSDSDIERMIFYHLSPINISVHTTDPDLRVFMLKNPQAVKLVEQLKKFSNAGLDMNFQVVLCPEINDKEHLDKTISDLSQFIPRGKSLSVVPVGISKYREENGLMNMPPFSKDAAAEVLVQIHGWQDKLKKQFGTSFVFAADEFYITAEQEIPPYEHYEDFPQLENGVGMIALMQREFDGEIYDLSIKKLNRNLTIATGAAAYGFIAGLAKELTERIKGLTINVVEIRNDFFGELITVSGLLTGCDIINQLKERELGDFLLIPINTLRDGEAVFLDDVTVQDLERELKIRVVIVDNNGADFIRNILEDI